MTVLILLAAGLVLIIGLCIDIHRRLKRFEGHAQEIRRACDILIRLFPLIRDHTPPLSPRAQADYQSQVVSPTRRRQEAEEELDEA